MANLNRKSVIISRGDYNEASRLGGLGDSVFGGRRECSQGEPCAEGRAASSGGMSPGNALCEVESFKFDAPSSGERRRATGHTMRTASVPSSEVVPDVVNGQRRGASLILGGVA